MTDYIRSGQFVVRLGDGGDPEEFTPSCLVNMDKSLSHSTNFQEDEVPDCQNPDAPASVVNTPRSKAITFSGTGKIDMDEYDVWVDWWKNNAAKNAQIDVGPSAENPGIRYEGPWFLETFEVSGPYKQVVEVNIALRPLSADEITTAPIPVS